MPRVPEQIDNPSAAITSSGLFCPTCGYDLRHNASGICPECGQPFDPATLAVSAIPWEHRRRLGRFRAFRRTAWVATVRVGLLRHEHARDLSFTAAQRFRWLCVLTAWLPPALALVLIGLAVSTSMSDSLGAAPGVITFGALTGGAGAPQTWGLTYDLTACAVVGLLLPGVAPVALLFCLIAFTGVSSYLFHPRSIPVERQNRAVALSAYLAAPLAWVPVGLAIFAVGGLLIWIDDDGSNLLLRVIAVAVAAVGAAIAVPILQTYVHTLLLLRWSTGANAGRMWAAALLLPVLWLAIAVLTLVGIPAAVGLVAIMLASTFS
jgi:hypothetical protein